MTIVTPTWKDEMAGFRDGIAERPDLFHYHYLIATILYRRGYFEEAMSHIEGGLLKKEHYAQVFDLVEDGTRYLSGEWFAWIGHIASLDAYFKAKALGWLGDRKTKVVLHDKQIANPALLEYFLPFFDEIANPYGPDERKREYFHNDYLSGFRLGDGSFTHYDALRTEAIRTWEEQQRKPLLTLKDDHRIMGREAMKRLGLPQDAWFVALHARNSLTTPFFDSRNANLDDYEKATRMIAQWGGHTVRMGDPMANPPDWPNLINYPESAEKSDWMDVYLSASCRFFLGTQSGLCEVPGCFGVPCAITNVVTLGIASPYPANRFLPQNLVSDVTGRSVSIADRLRAPYISMQDPDAMRERSVHLVPNSPEEIADLALEVLLDGGAPQGASFFKALGTSYGNARPGSGYLRGAL